MLRLKVTKTSLYKLVAEYVTDLPPMRMGTEFIRYSRTRDYELKWITGSRGRARAFLSACLGRCLLSIEVNGIYESTLDSQVYTIPLADLRERGLVEEFTTATERGRAEHGIGV